MAYTFTNFKEGLRSLFGHGQTNVSGDGGGDVKGHVGQLVERTYGPFEVAAAAASATSTYAMLAAFTVENECDLKGIRIVIDAALTTSVTDYFVLRAIKKKASTWSVTESVATLNYGQVSTWTVNVAGMSKAFTLATTSSVLDLDPGDTISLNGTLNGANALGSAKSMFYITVEEK